MNAGISHNVFVTSTDEMQTLRSRMTQQVAVIIPGFGKSGRETPVVQYGFADQSCARWYKDSADRLLAQLGKRYFPVFRFSDGECYFCLGYRMPPPETGQNAVVHYMRTALSAYVKYRCHRTFWSGQPGYGHEIYRGAQWKSLQKVFSILLRDIADQGIVAANFCHHPGFESMNRYVPDIFNWFDSQGVYLNDENYIPFYFIYALLLGPERHKFLRNHKILVITNLADGKESRLRAYFEAEGAARVEFIGISRSSSMTERIELRPEHSGADLVLIGAGVGAANILSQVQPLQTLCIDAGYVLECYQNPAFKGKRVFTKPDEDFAADNDVKHEAVLAAK